MTIDEPLDLKEWKDRNRALISQRVAFLRDLPDGTIHERPGTMHHLMIRKIGSRLELVFLGGKSGEVISDFDYADPLDLFAGFTQAMTLGLLWKPDPKRVYVLGFGAGRVPMILHHYYPDVIIESTDIDEDVVDVSREFCGMATDERQQVYIEDGRKYLADRNATVRYDIIMVDAFRGVGYSPPLLATREFYRICLDHLAADGVVVVNLMMGDYLLPEKVKTLTECFKSVRSVVVPSDGTSVFFASNNDDLTNAELSERAKLLMRRHEFVFPFMAHATNLRNVLESPEVARAVARAMVLTDALAAIVAPPETGHSGSAIRINTPDLAPRPGRKVGRNEPCPCGSGNKYKRCCGQA